ncbi:MAG: hypothetical protein Q8R16_02010 [bacterium]|nr:hypothetical protein [bacterium]
MTVFPGEQRPDVQFHEDVARERANVTEAHLAVARAYHAAEHTGTQTFAWLRDHRDCSEPLAFAIAERACPEDPPRILWR